MSRLVVFGSTSAAISIEANEWRASWRPIGLRPGAVGSTSLTWSAADLQARSARARTVEGMKGASAVRPKTSPSVLECEPVRVQRFPHNAGHGERPGSGFRLRRDRSLLGVPCAADADRPSGQVHVVPPERLQLSSPQPGEEGGGPQGPVLLGKCGQQGARLVWQGSHPGGRFPPPAAPTPRSAPVAVDGGFRLKGEDSASPPLRFVRVADPPRHAAAAARRKIAPNWVACATASSGRRPPTDDTLYTGDSAGARPSGPAARWRYRS